MNKFPGILTILLGVLTAQGAEPLRLENDALALRFDAVSGTLTAVQNKLTAETYGISGDEFALDTTQFRMGLAEMKTISVRVEGESLTARYESDAFVVVVNFTLRGSNHFAEKRLVLKAKRPFGLKNLVLSQPKFSGAPLELVAYKHMKTTTYFGRGPQGGVFTGVELAYDHSSKLGSHEVRLAYAPSLKLAADEEVVCEPIYLGVYRRLAGEQAAKALPLRSESNAMVAMTSALLPAQHHRLGPLMCGWWSEGWKSGPYRTMADVEHDMRSIDFATACGIDIVSDGRAWAGETAKVNALRGDDHLQLGELPLKLAAYAKEKGVRWMFWPTMGHSDPWGGKRGQPFRPDQPDWRMLPRNIPCFAHEPSFQWQSQLGLKALEAGHYGGWCMDGDFFGEPGFGGSPGFNGAGANGKPAEPWVHAARCDSDLHDHLPGDSDYICQRNLMRMVKQVRQRYPDIYMLPGRPTMDLGVWNLRHWDACFTINEWAGLQGLPGMGPQPKNVLLGDKIRHWSRTRVHYHFFPHYLDSPLVFDAPKSMAHYSKGREWTSEHIDYIMLSALSSSPNQTYYLPSQAGIPDEDKRRIKYWLDWGRKNIEQLMVRKDLPDWPAPGKVDGSAHIVGSAGLVFLFNPNDRPLSGGFALTAESIGLKGEGPSSITQEYPAPGHTRTARAGETIRWEVPAQTAVVLRIQAAETK